MIPNSVRTVFYEFLDHFSASYTRQILGEAIRLLGQLWPYLVAGIVISTVIKVFVSKEQMSAFFSRRRETSTILFAAFIGLLSPVGSYVIIPMSAALLVIGVPLPALMALMVSSPLMNPNLFVLTAGAMGLEMAILRVLSAFFLGAVAGYTSRWLIRKQFLFPDKVIRDNQQFTLDQFSGSISERTVSGFLLELYKMARYVSKYFFLAILLAAGIKIAVNPSIIIKLFNSDGILSVILSTAAGVPFYVCGGAAIPVVQQLADLGMSQGAVLAYFISGPVTKISNLVLIQATFKRTILIQYLTIGILGAMAFGLLYNLF
ncbi:MAG: permease [Bacteroidales bacterium]|nr:permease [Bacteroidales bacterium]